MARLDVSSSRRDPEEEEGEINYSEKTVEEEERKEEGIPSGDLPFQIGEHLDCKDTVNKWLNAEIIALKNEEIKVHYTGWSNKYDEWIPVTSGRLLKQWEPGNPFQLNHRLDIKDKYDKWLEARVVSLDTETITVHFKNYKSIYDETLPKSSEKIQGVGKHSSAFGAARFGKRSLLTTSDSQKQRSAQRKEKEAQMTEEERQRRIQEERNFLAKLRAENMSIRVMHGDGNCLFRTVADQVYGDQELHSMVRQKCMDYLDVEREFFGSYIVGGIQRFDQYLQEKRKDGCWGDDIEIQVMSEIYNTPIEIYAYSTKPMRTFHEQSDEGAKALKLSYHGNSHYNSIAPLEGISPLFDISRAGEIEDLAIRKAIEAKEEEKRKAQDVAQTEKDTIREMVRQSRETFEAQGVRDMEIALEESLKEYDRQEKPPGEVENEEEMAVKESLREYEEKLMVDSEQQIIEATLKESKQEIFDHDILEIEKKELEEALKSSSTEAHGDFGMTDGVKVALDAGYPLELVIQARDIVGDNPNMIIDFIHENLIQLVSLNPGQGSRSG